ncbi:MULTISPECIES: tRNA (adenosine(37)-N6)-threonylcarbamoyltransferase complex dimerization subunit type 1 TsaB [unclassified Synechocystis]|uniref:tRNA (adenosine(37)-N6)-threonylcarbamoyltransferase complex dimerization subunit type 1 TsaB n=1 Tax=unclassified Synechocystis TaxID=2640012 RepID=UPI0003F939BB|nr:MULTISPECIES: tRNA (adenosine(37)-N6)-threonylcarbamoyltransferase complex dimerization subunit type 1 TsaB [unclassified Synechocystis]AIE74346.1 Inactive metal-dependent protease, putative molecular chaperone [Synechocystis sp. PCC 6714]MCT0254874.1 tRNA (adenosine(37)-N6)-threonylcarbamoyltransferase complex dimerization subunit type 1 TsaB [Synechocystis sp. CS-94]
MTVPPSISSPDESLGLALHSATGQLGLALQRGETLLHQQAWELDRQLLNQLHGCLADFFPYQQWSQLNYLAVAQGPGSFTSVRIGMVTARTLAQQLQIPLFPISTLACFAQSLINICNNGELLAVTMSATRGYLYGALYRIAEGTLITLDGDRLWLPEDWQQFMEDKQVEQVHRVPDRLGINAPQLLTLARQRWLLGDRPHWSAAQPFYGMSPTDPVVN